MSSRIGVHVVCLLLSSASIALAQAPSDQHEHQKPEAPAADHTGHTMQSELFSGREGSGTSWLPENTPMYGAHRRAGAWELMLHGNAFIQYLNEFAPVHRGADQGGSINWIMGMAKRPLGDGRMGLRLMLSLEPWTIAGCGYPNLLATGERCDGDGIHDRQHQHDLFMEVAADYERRVSSALTWQLYGGLAGEPALGPVAFPHRPSAMPNPLAPISHHWLDATHITYGVVTTGISGRRWNAETSIFNGREPDEIRTNFDFGALDSFSGRLTFLPTNEIALQVSAAHLEEAEIESILAPRVDVNRVTASATYHRRLNEGGLLAATLAWGSNSEGGERTHAGLAEASLSLRDVDTFFGRLELGGKPAHDLHIHESEDVFTVGKAQVGYTRYFSGPAGLRAGVGGSVSASFVPEALQPRYGGVGLGIGLFATLRPVAH